MKRSTAVAVILAALIVGGCGQQQSPKRSTSSANRPSKGVQGSSATNAPSKQQAERKFGAKPGVSEYRVHSELNLLLGKGVSGSVNGGDGPYDFKCVNGNGGFAFTTATDEEKHDLWIDASTSVVPPCFQDKSYQYFVVHIYGPYKGTLSGLLLSQAQAGSPYYLKCPQGPSLPGARVGCRQKGTLAVEITCIQPEPYSQEPRCV